MYSHSATLKTLDFENINVAMNALESLDLLFKDILEHREKINHAFKKPISIEELHVIFHQITALHYALMNFKRYLYIDNTALACLKLPIMDEDN